MEIKLALGKTLMWMGFAGLAVCGIILACKVSTLFAATCLFAVLFVVGIFIIYEA